MRQKKTYKTTDWPFLKRRIQTVETFGSDTALMDIAGNVDQYFNVSNVHFFKNDHSTSVIRIKARDRTLIARRDNPARLIKFARRLCQPSRSRKIWNKALWLKHKGLETITPLAIVEDFLFFIRLRSFIIVEPIEGRTFKSFLADPAVSYSSKLQMSSRIVSLIRHWHTLGITHGDPKGSNIMVNKNKAVLIDIEDAAEPRTKTGQKRSFARDWAIILHNLQPYEELRTKAQDEIVPLFDGDPDYFSKRLVQKSLAREHTIAGETFGKIIPPGELDAIITGQKPSQNWITLHRSKTFTHLFHKSRDIHLLVSFHGAIKAPSNVNGIYSMALAIGICGIGHVKLLAGGHKGKAEYLMYSTAETQTVETILKQLENSPDQQSELMAQVGASLGRLHLRGFIHNDLCLANIYAQKKDCGYTILVAVTKRTKWYGKRINRKISTDLSGMYTQLNSRYHHLLPAFKTAYSRAFTSCIKEPFNHCD